VRAIVTLAGALGLEVIAEGIETLEQRDALVELGCSLGQGFLYAYPRPADEVLLQPALGLGLGPATPGQA
ncbi:MAG: EAL domain-containing protein, partial [Xanthomonadales bacterium]|nr:EAL domain-containing protein [Xanthomonadales bacterium]